MRSFPSCLRLPCHRRGIKAASVVADMFADAAEFRGRSHDVFPTDYSNTSMLEAVKTFATPTAMPKACAVAFQTFGHDLAMELPGVETSWPCYRSAYK